MSENVKSWNLEKYAYLEDNKWIKTDKGNNDLKLMIQGYLLLVVHGGIALETVTLNKINIRVLSKGSSLMMLVEQQQDSKDNTQDKEDPANKKKIRKFRLKFGAEHGKTDKQQKTSCVEVLQDFVVIHDIDNVAQKAAGKLEKSIPSQIVPLQEIVQGLLEKNKGTGLPAWDDVNYLLKDGNILERAVKICLLDRSFPKLVRQVEDILEKTNSASK